MLISDDIKLDYSDVLIRPKRSTLKSRKEVDLLRPMKFRNSERMYQGVPIMAANMDGVGTFEMADALSKLDIFTCLVKTYSAEELAEFFNKSDIENTIHRQQNVAMSIGTSDSDLEKFKKVYKLTDGILKYLCVDVANGYTEMFSNFIYDLRSNYPDLVIIAGNVVTGDMTQELILNGADIVKCGIGPGSVCTTRIQTGVGYPQLSAIIECADAAHGCNGHIISDGGITCPGDAAKAFGAGADFVMLGSILAGHDESGGELIEENDEKYKVFYGMSSDTAMCKHYGGVNKYRSSEGKTVKIKYKGSVENTINDLLGGIRSSMGYLGCANIKELHTKAKFVKITNAGMRESHVHDVAITKEAPNYQIDK
jgi:GMP reductase